MNESAESVFIRQVEKYNARLNEPIEKRQPFYDFSLPSVSDDAHWNDELDSIYAENSGGGGVYPAEYYERIAARKIIHNHMRLNHSTGGLRICDFGCSSGYMLRDMKTAASDNIFIGVDVVDSGLLRLHQLDPEITLFKFDITRIPFPSKSLDIILCFNVLEHILNDTKVLEEFHRVLKDDGCACIIVPFGQKLYDYYDKAALHYRRYGRGELCGKVQTAGFKILRHKFLFPVMFIPFYLTKKLNRILYKNLSGDELAVKLMKTIKGTSNPITKAGFALDHLLSWLNLPWGIRELVLLKTGG